MRRVTLAGGAVVALLGIWTAIHGQTPPASPEVADRVEVLEERLAGVEKLLAGVIVSPGGQTSVSLAARLERIDSRLARLESEATRYRPGTPASSAQVEGRLRALEREVARLRR